jgi:hypothetical protein
MDNFKGSCHDVALNQAQEKPINIALIHHNLHTKKKTLRIQLNKLALGGEKKESKELSR